MSKVGLTLLPDYSKGNEKVKLYIPSGRLYNPYGVYER